VSLRVSGGIHLTVNRQVSLGASIDSPVSVRKRQQPGRAHDQRESMLTGVRFLVSDSLRLFADLFLQHPFPPSWRVAFESRLSGPFHLRGGVTGAPERILVGFSVLTGALVFHFAFEYHMLLGLSNAIEIELVL
jgi:hypothetical protein